MNRVVRSVGLDEPLKDFRGQYILNPATNAADMSIREIFISSLFKTISYDDMTNGNAKYQKYLLAKRCNDISDIQELDHVERATLKKAVGETQPPQVVGVIWDILASYNT